jgi:radical SAM superfamily enzyme YgiQ (UPF0313 family)
LAAFIRSQGLEPAILDMALQEVTTQQVDQTIRERAISLAGIGCMTCEFPAAIKEAQRLKAAHPGLRIVLGGAHPSGDPEECLRTGVVDFVIAGEGEITLTQLMAALRDRRSTSDFPRVWNIPGVWSIEDGVIHPGGRAPVPVVNELPRPAYDLVELESYFRLDSPWHFPKSYRAVQFLTERGCPYQCSYCHDIHTKKFRGLSSDAVLDQMEWLVRRYGVQELMIVDDIFNFDLERAKRICRGIVERGLNIHLQFPNGIRGDRLDEELVRLMSEAGTHFIGIAFETISEKFQKLVRKNLKIGRALQSVEWARKYGIEVSGYFMIGFPNETEEEARQTLDFAVAAPFDSIFISLVAPFQGTKLRTDIEEGRFGPVPRPPDGGLFPVVVNPRLPLELLLKLQREAYWRFYLKPRSVWKIASRLTNFRNAVKLTRGIARRIAHREPVSVN